MANLTWGEVLGVSAIAGLLWLGAKSRERVNELAELEEEEQEEHAEAIGDIAQADVLAEALAELRAERLARLGGLDHRPDELAWSRATRAPVRGDNPPEWVQDESVWERAKTQVRPYWHSYEDPWGVVTHVYKQMGGRT